jgi:hypothetical protein
MLRETGSLYYLSRFDGGELFGVHILSKLEDLDVSVMLALRTVCKAWLSLPYSMTTVCSLVECERRRDVSFYDAVLRHFPRTQRLTLCKDSPLVLHDLFLNLRKLSLTGLLDAHCDYTFLFAMTRLTSLTLIAATTKLSDQQLMGLTGLRRLCLRGPFPGINGTCLAALTSLESLSIHTVPSIQPRYFVQAPLPRLRLKCNSSSLLKNSHYTGHCRLYAYKEDRLCYVGSFVNGEMAGRGVYYYASGCRYVGEWANSVRCGLGTYYFVNGNRYEGEWARDAREGKGTLYFSDGARYTGDWLNDTREGYGVHVFASQSRYEGAWRNGKREGEGVCYYTDGGRYEGQWVEDKRKGWGTLYFASGLRHEGEWDRNVREGSGTFYNDLCHDADRVEGQWRNDELQPFGVYFFGRATTTAIQYGMGAALAVLTGSVLLKACRKFY